MNPIQQLIAKIDQEELWDGSIALRRNEYLKVSGSVDTRMYCIESGSLRIFVVDEFEEHTIRFGYAGDFIAALDSFITEQPSELYIQALKKCSIKYLKKDVYLNFMQSNEENSKLWNQILSQLVYQQMQRERDLLTSSPAVRYKRVLSRSPRLFQEIPHKYIASYLRMTPETLSRLKKS